MGTWDDPAQINQYDSSQDTLVDRIRRPLAQGLQQGRLLGPLLGALIGAPRTPGDAMKQTRANTMEGYYNQNMQGQIDERKKLMEEQAQRLAYAKAVNPLQVSQARLAAAVQAGETGLKPFTNPDQVALNLPTIPGRQDVDLAPTRDVPANTGGLLEAMKNVPLPSDDQRSPWEEPAPVNPEGMTAAQRIKEALPSYPVATDRHQALEQQKFKDKIEILKATQNGTLNALHERATLKAQRTPNLPETLDGLKRWHEQNIPGSTPAIAADWAQKYDLQRYHGNRTSAPKEAGYKDRKEYLLAKANVDAAKQKGHTASPDDLATIDAYEQTYSKNAGNTVVDPAQFDR